MKEKYKTNLSEKTLVHVCVGVGVLGGWVWVWVCLWYVHVCVF